MTGVANAFVVYGYDVEHHRAVHRLVEAVSRTKAEELYARRFPKYEVRSSRAAGTMDLKMLRLEAKEKK